MTTKTKVGVRGPGGLLLVLDRSECYPDDPGNGTPAVVNLFDASATLACASGTGTLMRNRGGDVELTEAQSRWLGEVETFAEDWCWAKNDAALDSIFKVKGTRA